MSYHTNAILNPLPRLGARSVGMAGFGAFGLGAVNATLGANIVALARTFPNASDGEVIFRAVASTPGLSAAEVQAVTPSILGQIVSIARKNPAMSATTVLAQATAPKRPVVIQESTLAASAAAIARRAGPAAGAFFTACMSDPIGAKDTIKCDAAAEKQVATLTGDQLSFYNQCLSQKPSDVPVLFQHSACFTQAQQLTTGSGPTPPGGGTYAPPPDAPPADSGGLLSNKWVWIGGAVAFGGLAWVLLKKPKPAAPAHA